MFVGKARSLQLIGAPEGCFTWVGFVKIKKVLNNWPLFSLLNNVYNKRIILKQTKQCIFYIKLFTDVNYSCTYKVSTSYNYKHHLASLIFAGIATFTLKWSTHED